MSDAPVDIKRHLMKAREALRFNGHYPSAMELGESLLGAIDHLIDAVDALDDRQSPQSLRPSRGPEKH